MGSFLSLPSSKKRTWDQCQASQDQSRKRMKMSPSLEEENPRLIPNLPDEISFQILARLPRMCYLNVKLVSRTWKAAVTSSEVFQIRKELGTTEEWLYILAKVEEDKLMWHALEPLSRKWQRLPPMPSFSEEEHKKGSSAFGMWNMAGSGIKITDVIRGWLGRRDRLDLMPFCGCAVGAVDGFLYVVGGFSKASAMKCVWRYNPRINIWQQVSSMNTGRAFCKMGLLNNKLYVVGGVSRGTGGLTPLRCAEVFDPQTGLWSKVPSMPFARAEALPTAFLADMLKPIATGMTSYNGKLCVPQSLYCWPFFVDIGGEVYDPETNTWSEMPAGMGDGWPARQAGTKLSVVVGGELYALDPLSSLDSGRIKIYDNKEDAWKVVIEKVPINDFRDSEAPYLLASLQGKLHVITKVRNNETAILQVNLQQYQLPSSSTSSSAPANSACESPAASEDEEVNAWKVIAAKDFGMAELINCQVLDV